jgi:hypothetical protein
MDRITHRMILGRRINRGLLVDEPADHLSAIAPELSDSRLNDSGNRPARRPEDKGAHDSRGR